MDTWTRKIETRTNANGDQEDFITYRSPRFPEYRIEFWGSNAWGWFRDDTFCSYRTKLADAKIAVAFDRNATERNGK